MPDSNPYAPPGAGTEGLDDRMSEQEVGQARRELAAHLADPVAVAADARGRRSLHNLLPGLAFLIGFWSIFAAVVHFCWRDLEMVRFDFHTWYVPGVLLISSVGMMLVMSAMSCAAHVQAKADNPVKAVGLWVHGLADNHPRLVLAMLAPGARTAASRPWFPLHRKLSPALERTLRLANLVAQGWSPQSWKIVRIREVGREGDLSLVEAELRAETIPIWCAAIGTILMSLMPFMLMFPVLVMLLVLNRPRQLICTKYLLCGSDGWWYLLDGRIEEDSRSIDG